MLALLIPVGREHCAVPLEAVLEVVTAPLPTPLPTAPATVLGLINLRGEIVPLLDTAALTGRGRVPATPFAVILETPAGPAGLVATALPQAVELEDPVAAGESPGIASYAVGGTIATLLDVEALLAPARIGETR